MYLRGKTILRLDFIYFTTELRVCFFFFLTMNHGLQKKIYYHSKSETNQLINIIIINYTMVHVIPIIITINGNNNLRAIHFFWVCSNYLRF